MSDLPPQKKSNANAAGWLFISLAVGYAVFFLLYTWTEIFSEKMFFKISVTYGVIATLAVVIFLIRNEFRETQKMKDNNYLD